MGQTSAYRFPYPDASDVVKVSSDMGDLATAIDTRLAFDSTRARPSVILAEAYDATQYLTEIVNTTTATQLFSVPLTGAVAGDVFIMNYHVSVLNFSGASRNATVTINIGTSTIFTGLIGAIAASNTMRAMQGELRIHVQTPTAHIVTTSFTLGGTALLSMNGGITLHQQNLNTSTEDLSVNPNLSMEITPNFASENYFFRLHAYNLRRLRIT
jgi:hypothetical protein